MKDWVISAIKHANMDQATLARGLTEKLGLNEDRSIVNKLVKGRRQLGADEMLAISDLTGYPIPGHVPLFEAAVSAGIDLAVLRKSLEVTFEQFGLDQPDAEALVDTIVEVARDAHLHAGGLQPTESARVLASAAVSRFLRARRPK